jgi:hypothetical protein
MDIMNLITRQLNDPKVIEQLSKSTGAKPGQVEQLAQEGLPLLLQALQQNAANPEGAKSLDKALEEHKDDKVDDVLGFLKNVDTNDGAKIIQHIFSSKSEAVQEDLATKAGANKNQVSALMIQLAPLVLGALGNQKKTQAGSQGDITGLIGNVIGSFFKR